MQMLIMLDKRGVFIFFFLPLPPSLPPFLRVGWGGEGGVGVSTLGGMGEAEQT